MKSSERRLVLDRSFDDAVDRVLDAFIREGFSVRSLDGGDLRRGRRSSSALRRYAQLDVVLPELASSCAALHVDDDAIVGCRIAIFELTDSSTLLTVENPTRRYAVLSNLAPEIDDRMARALRLVIHTNETINAA
jgi:hypothetical protein